MKSQGLKSQGLGISAKCLAMLLPLTLAACVSSGEDNSGISFTSDRGVANQPFPTDYRTQILAVMKSYINDPAGVRDPGMAEPTQRTVGGRLRYVSCLRYATKDGGEGQPRAAVYVDGRLDRVMENAGELCAGLSYAPFPELAALTR